jgi:hypothetical protein
MRSLTQSSAGPTAVIPNNSNPVLQHGPTNVPLRPPPPPLGHAATSTIVIPHVIQTHPPSPQPPFFEVHTDSPLLSARARGYISRAIRSSLAKSTINRYSGTIKQFIRFCNSERVPVHLRFPADELLLCAFAASSLGRHARNTSRSRLSALKAWHIAHNMEWKGSSRLRYVLNGVHNQAPGNSSRSPRPPINARMLIQLVEALDLTSPLDAAVAACATTAFWGSVV